MAEGTGTGALYSLNEASNDANAKLSDDFITNPTFRNGQEVAVYISSVDSTGKPNTSLVADNNSS